MVGPVRHHRPVTMEDQPSIFPLQWFVDRWNMQLDLRGAPFATALDPMVMMAWHLATESARKPMQILITGC